MYVKKDVRRGHCQEVLGLRKVVQSQAFRPGPLSRSVTIGLRIPQTVMIRRMELSKKVHSCDLCRIANQSCLAVVLASFREVQPHATSEKAVVDISTIANLLPCVFQFGQLLAGQQLQDGTGRK